MSEHVTTSPPPGPAPRRRWTERMLDAIEWAGNKLPDPAVLFLLALLLTWGLSVVLAPVEFADVDPRTRQPLVVHNQLTGEALARFLSRMVPTFTSFPPLGVVLVALGLGLDLLQRLTETRQFDWNDVAMNCAGVVAGLLLSWWLLGGWCQRVEQRLLS